MSNPYKIITSLPIFTHPTYGWIIKVMLLVLGQYYFQLGSILLLFDGYFHFTSTQKELEKDSPDWIVARAFGINGLSKTAHEIMGIVLITSSLLYIYFHNSHYLHPFMETPNKTMSDIANIVTTYLYPAFLIMITMAILLKQFYLSDGSSDSSGSSDLDTKTAFF